MRHDPTVENDGISFYGVYPPTIPLLIGAFAAGGVGLWRSAGALGTRWPALASALRAVASGLGLLLLTPYSLNAVFNWSHMTIGVVMALVQGGITIALVRRDPRVGTWAIFSLQLAGGLLAAVSLPAWPVAYLLQGEIVYEIGFGIAVLAWLRVLRTAP